MSWRVIVDSWGVEGADWYGRHVFLIEDQHSLPDAMRAVADLHPSEYLQEDRFELRSGSYEQAQGDYRLWRRARRREHEAMEAHDRDWRAGKFQHEGEDG